MACFFERFLCQGGDLSENRTALLENGADLSENDFGHAGVTARNEASRKAVRIHLRGVLR
jgi:hypothetical protein